MDIFKKIIINWENNIFNSKFFCGLTLFHEYMTFDSGKQRSAM